MKNIKYKLTKLKSSDWITFYNYERAVIRTFELTKCYIFYLEKALLDDIFKLSMADNYYITMTRSSS